jgi:hypothetical protein
LIASITTIPFVARSMMYSWQSFAIARACSFIFGSDVDSAISRSLYPCDDSSSTLALPLPAVAVSFLKSFVSFLHAWFRRVFHFHVWYVISIQLFFNKFGRRQVGTV